MMDALLETNPEITPHKFADFYSRQGVVYFIGAGKLDKLDKPPIAIKIGLTQASTVERRLRSLQCSNHEPLELLGLIGPKLMLEAEREEQALHIRFAHLQRIVNGNVGHEWFTAAPDLLGYITQYAVPPEKIGYRRSVARIAA